MDFRWRNNRLPNELHQRLGRRRRHRRHHLPDTAKKTQQKITQQIGVRAFVETSARWKGEKRRVCHFFIRRLLQPRGRSSIMAVGRPPVYQIWYKERKLTQCYSFLLPFPLRLSASCSLSLSSAVVCSQHVANRVNDVDACRKSHSESVGIASGRRVSRTMTDFFLVSRPESVASPFLPKHHEGYRVSTLVAIPGAGAPSLFIRVFVLPHELSCVFDSACTLSSIDAMKFCKLLSFSYLL